MNWLSTFLLIFSFSFIRAQDSIPPLNKSIVDLACKQMGKKVGRGECWDLAQFVLDSFHCKWDQQYEFGKKINYKKEKIYPGDIIQFEKVELKIQEGNKVYTTTLYHHTAVIKSVDGELMYTILEQNTSDFGKKVSQSTLNLKTLVKGKVQFFRPIQ